MQITDNKTYREILELIEEGDELEMPAGLARRLVDAGWVHPDGDSEMRFRVILERALTFSDESIDRIAASALLMAGARRG